MVQREKRGRFSPKGFRPSGGDFRDMRNLPVRWLFWFVDKADIGQVESDTPIVS